MKQAGEKELLTGIVEMDETWIGGKPRKGGKRKGSKVINAEDDEPSPRGRGTNKPIVLGAVERGGRVTAMATDKSKMKG